jgi:hypothetical protein
MVSAGAALFTAGVIGVVVAVGSSLRPIAAPIRRTSKNIADNMMRVIENLLFNLSNRSPQR